jgi:flagellar biosynthesis/type III secretory pathway protein FliH
LRPRPRRHRVARRGGKQAEKKEAERKRKAAIHDRLFRVTFGQVERAQALLRHALPPELVETLDLSTLRREMNALVVEEDETRKDLVYSARRLGSAPEEPPHFFIIEHQYEVEWDMAERLHDYAWRLTSDWREANPSSRWLPRVTALVVYPRRGKGWWAARKLEAMYGAPGVGRAAELVVRFEYEVDDLAKQSEEEVKKREGLALGPLVLLVLSYAGSKALARKLPGWRELFAATYAEPGGLRAVRRVVRYLYRLGDLEASRVAKDVLKSMMEPTQAEVMMRTMEEVLKRQGRREGKKEGLQEGRKEGLAEAVLECLADREIEVDEASRQRIESCQDAELLKRWLRRALRATRLSEVLEEPSAGSTPLPS